MGSRIILFIVAAWSTCGALLRETLAFSNSFTASQRKASLHRIRGGVAECLPFRQRLRSPLCMVAQAPDLDSTDPFIVLGLDPFGSDIIDKKAVKRAYKRLALRYHPDIATTKDSSEYEKRWASEQFSKINSAYEILSHNLEQELASLRSHMWRAQPPNMWNPQPRSNRRNRSPAGYNSQQGAYGSRSSYGSPGSYGSYGSYESCGSPVRPNPGQQQQRQRPRRPPVTDDNGFWVGDINYDEPPKSDSANSKGSRGASMGDPRQDYWNSPRVQGPDERYGSMGSPYGGIGSPYGGHWVGARDPRSQTSGETGEVHGEETIFKDFFTGNFDDFYTAATGADYKKPTKPSSSSNTKPNATTSSHQKSGGATSTDDVPATIFNDFVAQVGNRDLNPKHFNTNTAHVTNLDPIEGEETVFNDFYSGEKVASDKSSADSYLKLHFEKSVGGKPSGPETVFTDFLNGSVGSAAGGAESSTHAQSYGASVTNNGKAEKAYDPGSGASGGKSSSDATATSGATSASDATFYSTSWTSSNGAAKVQAKEDPYTAYYNSVYGQKSKEVTISGANGGTTTDASVTLNNGNANGSARNPFGAANSFANSVAPSGSYGTQYGYPIGNGVHGKDASRDSDSSSSRMKDDGVDEADDACDGLNGTQCSAADGTTNDSNGVHQNDVADAATIGANGAANGFKGVDHEASNGAVNGFNGVGYHPPNGAKDGSSGSAVDAANGAETSGYIEMHFDVVNGTTDGAVGVSNGKQHNGVNGVVNNSGGISNGARSGDKEISFGASTSVATSGRPETVINKEFVSGTKVASRSVGSGGGGVYQDIVDLLKRNVDGNVGGSGYILGSVDPELNNLLLAGTVEDIGTEMTDTELVVQHLTSKSADLDREILKIQAELASNKKLSNKIALEQLEAECKARKVVVDEFLPKAQERLRGLQSRYMDLIEEGRSRQENKGGHGPGAPTTRVKKQGSSWRSSWPPSGKAKDSNPFSPLYATTGNQGSESSPASQHNGSHQARGETQAQAEARKERAKQVRADDRFDSMIQDFVQLREGRGMMH